MKPNMSVFHWILLGGFFVFIVSFIAIFIDLLFIKTRRNYSKAQGSIKSGIIYSFTSGMSPVKKESAFLHLPTYLAGMIFHIGTFISFFWLAVCFLNITVSYWLRFSLAIAVFSAGICGFSILIKRIAMSKLRNLSNPDDYFSNLLVTGFQILTIFSLLRISSFPALFIYSTFLFLYIPVGKLKHTIYFFISRINLGIYYGKRRVWPVKK
jgi:nitrate reductase gamma subunit